MHNLKTLIPIRFLSLISHLIVSITLIWESQQSVNNCMGMEKTSITEPIFKSFHQQLLGGLGISLSLIAFELITYLSGVTMFHSTSALLSTLCHFTAAIVLTYFHLNSWQCGWFWIIFAFGSCLPAVFDCFVICGVCIRGKY